MCGIAGIWNLKGQKASKEDLRSMLTVQHHRGPEGAAFTSMNDSSVLMGFLQLGFTDNQFGMQPLFNEDGTIALVYNGEIYEYEVLRESLLQEGHVFKTQSDTEVLIHLYEKYGEDFVTRINGEFSFCLYDTNKDQMLLARDPFGIKPMTYHFNGHTFYFSSEAKGILVTHDFQRELNPDYLGSVAIGIPNSRITLFKNIDNVRPGHCLIVSKHGIKTYQYWKPSFAKVNDTFEEAKAKVKTNLTQAVTRRLQGNPPLAIALSSGLDSTIIAGLVSEGGYNNPVFSLGFPGRTFDESDVAEATSRHYGLKFNRVDVSLDDLAREFSNALWHSENTTNSLSNTGRYLTNKAVRTSGLKAVMGGESSDEIFGGYPYFMLERIWKMQSEGDPTATHQYRMFKKNEADSYRIFWDATQGWKNKPAPYSNNHLAFFRAQKAKAYSRWIWSPDVFKETKYPADELFLEELPPAMLSELSSFDSSRLIARSIAATFIFPGLGDRLEMGGSLEGRVPFLDRDVVNYAYSLQEDFFLDVRQLKGKRVLWSAFKEMLPPQFRPPAKHTFMAPTFQEMFGMKGGGELKEHYLSIKNMRQSGITNSLTSYALIQLGRLLSRNSSSYLFVESLAGLFLSIEILNDLFIKNHPLKRVQGKVLEIREHFPPKTSVMNSA